MAHATHHAPSTTPGNGRLPEAQPITRQRSREMQPYGTLARYPLALGDDVRTASVEALNQVLCNTIVLRDLYKKHHWQVSGPTFYALHLLFDKHAGEQADRIDPLRELRVKAAGRGEALPGQSGRAVIRPAACR
jgi:starvation-inducible DNA-binding protein